MSLTCSALVYAAGSAFRSVGRLECRAPDVEWLGSRSARPSLNIGGIVRREGCRRVRRLTVTGNWGLVSRSIDHAFKELSELDSTTGEDGRLVINTSELYTGILIVYDNVNQLVPGMHISPPSKKQVVQLVQDYDINHDGVIDRDEFGRLVRHFARTIVARVLLNLLLIFSLVPFLVSVAAKLAARVGWKVPQALAATVITLLIKTTGV